MPQDSTGFMPLRPRPEPTPPTNEPRRDTGRSGEALRILRRDGIVAIRGAFRSTVVGGAIVDFGRLIGAVRADPFGHSQFGGMADHGELAGSPDLSSLVVAPIVERVCRGYLGPQARWSYWRGYRIEPLSPRHYRAFQPHVDGHLHELKAMILLTPTSADQQCMLYWPGTHRIDWKIQRSSDTVFGSQLTRHLSEPFRATGAPGDIILFDTNGIHSGQRNLSARRDAVVSNFSATEFGYVVPLLHPDVAAVLDPDARRFFRVADDGAQSSGRGDRGTAEVEGLGPAAATPLATEALCALALKDRRERLVAQGDADYLEGWPAERALGYAAHGDLNLPQHLSEVWRIVRRDQAIGRVRDLRYTPSALPGSRGPPAPDRASAASDLAEIGARLGQSERTDQADLGYLLADLSTCIAEARARSYMLNSIALAIVALPHVGPEEQADSLRLRDGLGKAFRRVLCKTQAW